MFSRRAAVFVLLISPVVNQDKGRGTSDTRATNVNHWTVRAAHGRKSCSSRDEPVVFLVFPVLLAAPALLMPRPAPVAFLRVDHGFLQAQLAVRVPSKTRPLGNPDCALWGKLRPCTSDNAYRKPEYGSLQRNQTQRPSLASSPLLFALLQHQEDRPLPPAIFPTSPRHAGSPNPTRHRDATRTATRPLALTTLRPQTAPPLSSPEPRSMCVLFCPLRWCLVGTS